MTTRFTWDGIAARLLFSLFVVFATYNPSGRSFWHWLWDGEAGPWTKLATGLVLLLTHLAILFTLRGALGWRGVLAVAITLAVIMRAAAEFGVEAPAGGWPGLGPLILLSLLYAFGLSWSLLHHRVAGVVHTEQMK